MTRSTIFAAFLALTLLLQGCASSSEEITINNDTVTTETPVVTVQPPTETATPLPSPTPAPSAEPSPAPTAVSAVRIVASGGNLYIRRGPEVAYDRIGVLTKGNSAEVIGQDVLSKWVQIRIPDSELTGWVSLLTPFTTIEGDLATVSAFTFTDWPKPAYVKNCTEHEILISPGDIYLKSLWTNQDYLNQAQIDPGTYEIHDLSMEDLPLIEVVEIREGQTYYITLNGDGVYHNCPAEN